MPLQLRRILTLLVFLIIIFIVIRHFLVPESFGELGHYRANSIKENQAIPIKYIGNDDCMMCHEDEGNMLTQSVHNSIKCETCHGAGFMHIETNEAADILNPSGRNFCATCHELNAARSNTVVKQVNTAEHNIEEGDCINCHNPHDPWN